MASYSELLFSSTAAPPGSGELVGDAPYLVSRYHLPLLWLALFDRSSLQPAVDGEDAYEGYFAAPVDLAIHFLISRQAFLLGAFEHLDFVWLAQFKQFLLDAQHTYVHLDCREVAAGQFTPAEWAVELSTVLEMFEKDPVQAKNGLIRYRELFGMGASTKQKESWAFCGVSGTELPASWEAPPL